MLSDEIIVIAKKIKFSNINKLIKLFKERTKIKYSDPKREELDKQIASSKKEILDEFEKFVIDKLSKDKQKHGEEHYKNYFLGSLSYNLNEDFTKLLTGKDYPTWHTIIKDTYVVEIKTREYNKSFKNAFDKVYGKGAFDESKKLNKKSFDINSGLKLKSNIRNKINKELADIGKQPVDKIPLDDMFKILKKQKVIAVQEDGTKWSGIFTGRDGKAKIELAPEDSLEGKFYKPFDNAELIVTWHKFNTGRYEVVAYVS